jgi:hypothetical protein
MHLPLGPLVRWFLEKSVLDLVSYSSLRLAGANVNLLQIVNIEVIAALRQVGQLIGSAVISQVDPVIDTELGNAHGGGSLWNGENNEKKALLQSCFLTERCNQFYQYKKHSILEKWIAPKWKQHHHLNNPPERRKIDRAWSS